MKKIIILLSVLFITQVKAQDYLKLQTFKLDNGFTVYLLPDKNATSTFGAVAVNAGAKNDPADATGLAHYLEHLLFKGTQVMGTTDYEKEKPFLDSITIYYQQMGKTTDPAQRQRLTALINNQSLGASKYGLPTEFHTLLSSIGGTGINAFTQEDMTVFHNTFPGEQMEKWLDLYATRFTNPVFRSFQSELEVVYEEKNRGSDNFGQSLIELLNKHLYPNHPYGTQTTIGTSEHLKNPPIDRIYEFYQSYYVANNMALFLVGNFDPEKTIPVIKEKFSKMRTGVVPKFADIPPYKFTKTEVSDIRITPIKLDVIGFKTIPNGHPDEVPLEVCNKLLFNESETGLLNKLQQDGKLLQAFTFSYHQHDDGAEILLVIPKIVGQSFGKAENCVFTELTKLSTGDFPDEFLTRVKSELIKNYKREMEDPQSRGFKLFGVFNSGKDWNYVTSYPDEVNKITKQDIMRIATKYYTGYHYAIHSKTGFPKKDHLDKPGFKPALNDQNSKSVYAQKFEKTPNASTAPKFLDFKNDEKRIALGKNNELFAVTNYYNDIASLKIKYYAGKEKITNLDLAVMILRESSVKGMKLADYKKALAELNCTVDFSADDDFFNVEINGDEKNINAALMLTKKLLQNPEASPSAEKNMKEAMDASYKQEQKDPATMGRVLMNYGRYGDHSEFKKRSSLSAIKSLKSEDLLKLISEATSYSASIHYCGNVDFATVAEGIQNNYLLSDKGKPALTYHEPKGVLKPLIYVVDDNQARQNQVYFSVICNSYNPAEDAKLSLLGQYMGGAFSGIILQEIREFRSLAYSAGGSFHKPSDPGKPLLFTSFVGCQADKTNESIDVMMNLLQNLPKHPDRMDPFKTYVISSISTGYPSPRSHTETLEELQLQGFSVDPKINEFNTVNQVSFDDLYAYYEKNFKGKPIMITVYGDKSKVDMEKLKKIGEVIELKKEDIATY